MTDRERRLREAAEERLAELRRRARRGDPDARRELQALGEVAPPVTHWSEVEFDEDED